MLGSLDRRDRQLLIGAGLLLVVLVVIAALVGPPSVTGSAGLPSSYSPAWSGAKGAYLLLARLGYPVERWEKPEAQIPGPDPGTVLVLADPAYASTSQDRIAIRRFVEAGGRVLAAGPSAAPFLPEAKPFTLSPFAASRQFSARAPSPLARGVSTIELPAPIAWHPTEPAHLVAFGDAGTAAVVSWPFGRGEVVWWASSVPLTNGGIRDADNLALFLNSIGPPGTRVLWDEYAHGVRASLWSFLAPTPMPWILAQIAIVFLALLFTYSRRLAPARVPAVPSRLSPLEFVETLGDLYHTARAGAAAVDAAYGRLRFLLLRQLALPSSASVAEIARAASSRLGWDEAALLDTLSRAERSMRAVGLEEDDALKLVRELHDCMARLEITPAGKRKDTR